MTEQRPMSTQDQQRQQEQQRQDAQRAYDEAIKQMTDRHLFDRVRAAHPHANTGPDQLKAMQEDYQRLEAEQRRAQGHGGDPGHQGQGQGQANAPGQNKPPEAQPR